MKPKQIASIVILYLLVLVQASFLARFDGGLAVLVVSPAIIAVAAVNLFERQKNTSGLTAAVFGGFFMDVYSERFFGFWIAILLGVALVIKYVLKRYVRFPAFW